MSLDTEPESLIEQLDRMQDEVLQGLDELDDKINALIKQCTAVHHGELHVVGEDESLPEAA